MGTDTFFDELCLLTIGIDRGQRLRAKLSRIDDDDGYFCKVRYFAGGFYRYVPEQGIILVAFTLGDSS